MGQVALIGDARGAVGAINDSATLKTEPLCCCLHNDIILMGIKSDIVFLSLCLGAFSNQFDGLLAAHVFDVETKHDDAVETACNLCIRVNPRRILLAEK